MRKACELVGSVLLVLGLGGLVHHFIGWFGKWAVVRYVPFLDGYELYANAALAVVGFLMVAVAEDAAKRPSGPLISDADRARPE
jgi:hypothetical protein